MTETLRTVQLPANELTVPVASEQMFMVRHSDWKRMRVRVEALGVPLKGLANLAWTVVGIGGSAFFGWLAWIAAEEQLSVAQRVKFAAMSPGLFIAFAASAVLAIAFFYVDSKLVKHTSLSVEQVVAEMDDLYAPYKDYTASGPTDAPTPVSRPALGSALSDSEVAIEQAPRSTAARNNGVPRARFKPGDRIRHGTFGDGVIVGLTSTGRGPVATVNFDSGMTKRLLLDIAPIKLL